MAEGSVSLDKWRDYFRRSGSDIFKIIEYAILVAASDCPYDFKLKRDRIAETLFTYKVTNCFGCGKIEMPLPNADGLVKSEIDGGGSKDTKESKVNSSSSRDYGDDHPEVMEMNTNHVANYICGDAEAEALTDVIEEESQIYGAVLRIKDVLENFEEESDALVLASLRKLQLTPLSVEMLKATEIGKSVNALRKHGSKKIRSHVRTLVEDWKVMVDSWVNATAAVSAAELATESVTASAVEDEEGLPSPPLDEGAFFTPPISMELSQFFDGMDDNGNPQSSGALNKKTEPKRNHEGTLMKQSPPKPNKPSVDDSGPGRPKAPSIASTNGRSKLCVRPNIDNGIKCQQKSENRQIQKKAMPPQLKQKEYPKYDASVRIKLEAAKRKLQERYEEADNAKKQRTIQVVEPQDLPKQRKNQHKKQWCNGPR